MGGGASKSTASRAKADAIFDEIDANRDGKLSVKELTIAAMQRDIQTAWPKWLIEETIARYDTDDDHMLDREEWARAFVTLRTPAQKKKEFGFTLAPLKASDAGDVLMLSTLKKLLFCFFPAGFVQCFTDFPFNGDLAHSAFFFLAHQVLSLSEVTAMVVASLCRAATSPMVQTCSVVALAVIGSKGILFVAYFHTKIKASHHSEGIKARATTRATTQTTQKESKDAAETAEA